MGARNDAELRAMIEPKLQQAVDYVVEKIWEENRSIVEKVVYGAGSPSVYERTHTLAEAWTYESGGGGGISASFKSDPSALAPHPSALTGEDVRDGLIEIVYEGMAGLLFGEGFWTKKRDAFSALEKSLGVRKFNKFFQAGMTAAGLPWKKRR